MKEGLRIHTLASGSKGNCSIIEGAKTSVILDAGMNFKSFLSRASFLGAGFDKISAILITHEHTDHISGVASLAEELGVPVYGHPAVLSYIRKKNPQFIDLRDDDGFEGGFYIDDLWVQPFRVPHDALFTAGYRLTDGKSVLAAATDLGEITEGVLQNLKGADTVLLESNHDFDMLIKGRYHWGLKKRIYGRGGHLSNDAAANTAVELAKSGTKSLVLAHLSEENNTPETAFNTTARALFEAGIKEGYDIGVSVACAAFTGAVI